MAGIENRNRAGCRHGEAPPVGGAGVAGLGGRVQLVEHGAQGARDGRGVLLDQYPVISAAMKLTGGRTASKSALAYPQLGDPPSKVRSIPR